MDIAVQWSNQGHVLVAPFLDLDHGIMHIKSVGYDANAYVKSLSLVTYETMFNIPMSSKKH